MSIKIYGYIFYFFFLLQKVMHLIFQQFLNNDTIDFRFYDLNLENIFFYNDVFLFLNLYIQVFQMNDLDFYNLLLFFIFLLYVRLLLFTNVDDIFNAKYLYIYYLVLLLKFDIFFSGIINFSIFVVFFKSVFSLFYLKFIKIFLHC